LKPSRPLGISIIAVLDILGGIIALFLGFITIILSSLLSLVPYYEMVSNYSVNPSILIIFSGFPTVVLGGLLIASGYMLWRGWEFARILHIILSVISIPWGILTLILGSNTLISFIIGSFNILISLILIWYLTRSHVKAFFKYYTSGYTEETSIT